MSRAMGSHHSARMVTDVWLTPPAILGPLGEFDLDPCAAPDPRPWPTARQHIALPDDGLAARWHGRVWLNPPYSRDAVRWIARLADHGTGTALVFARTETRWFVDHIWRRASALLFLHGRVHFHHADGAQAAANAGAPSVLVAYGERDAEALRHCGLNGSYVEGWRHGAAQRASDVDRLRADLDSAQMYLEITAAERDALAVGCCRACRIPKQQANTAA